MMLGTNLGRLQAEAYGQHDRTRDKGRSVERAACSSSRAASKRRRNLSEMEAYCLKCRTRREMQNPQQVTMKNGKPATKGTCPVCSTQMYRIGKK